MLLGWALVSSGLYNQNQSFPEFAAAVASQVKKHDQFEDCIRRLQGLPASSDSYTQAMMTYLNPFWYESIRKTIDDNACPFYHALYSDSDLARDYSRATFLARLGYGSGWRATVSKETWYCLVGVRASEPPKY